LIGSRTYGVMKKARIVGVSVLDGSGTGAYSTIAAGLTWAFQDHQSNKRVGVINMSIGGPKSDFINNAVNAITNAGLPIVVAAGNEAKDACDTSPASAQGAITVGATNDQNKLASFSNFGSCVTVLSPGENLLSTWLNGNTAWLSGTSMASPVVAGVIASYQSWLPRMSAASLKLKLVNQAIKAQIGGLPADNKTPNLVAYNGFSSYQDCKAFRAPFFSYTKEDNEVIFNSRAVVVYQ